MNVMAKRDAAVRPDLNNPELNNLAMSKEAQPLFDAVTILTCLIQGSAVLIAVALLYAWLQWTGVPADAAKFLVFRRALASKECIQLPPAMAANDLLVPVPGHHATTGPGLPAVLSTTPGSLEPSDATGADSSRAAAPAVPRRSW